MNNEQQALDLSHKPDFDGVTYEPKRDRKRLVGQLNGVYEVMKNGEWYSIETIKVHVIAYTGKHASEASISARIRDLRKDKFGGHTVERKSCGNGLWKYRLIN